MINPEVFNNQENLKEGLKQPFFIVRNALVPEIAEALHAELMKAGDWDRQSLVEANFIYQRDKIAMGSGIP